MNRKHTDEEREQAVLYYLESGKGMLAVSKEIRSGVNTLNRWVKAYKERHGIPENSCSQPTNEELMQKIKELERENKEKSRQCIVMMKMVIH